MQEPEELSVDEVLASIRDILSKELKEDFVSEPENLTEQQATSAPEAMLVAPEAAASAAVESDASETASAFVREAASEVAASASSAAVRADDAGKPFVLKNPITANGILLLTPEMRVMPADEIAFSKEKVRLALYKLSKAGADKEAEEAQLSAQIRPLLKKWIEKNMPELIERILADEIKPLLNKKKL